MDEGGGRRLLRAELIGPWNKQDAKWAIVALMTVISVITLLTAFTQPEPNIVGRVISLAIPAYWVIGGPLIARFGQVRHDSMYVVVPIIATSLQATMTVLNHDRTAAAQVVFVLASLYAGSQLKPLGAILVTGGGIINEAVVAFLVLPFHEALRDWIAITVIFCTVTLLLGRGGRAQQALNEVLRQQAAVDSLTGLVNRRVLEEAASSALVSAAHSEGTGLILLDVDNFKQINDGYGHPVGDRALAHIAEVIVRHTRRDAVVSRFGGDEMAVLMPGCSYEVAYRRATELVAAIHAEPLYLPDSGQSLQLSASVGVAHAPTHGDSLARVYEAADAGIYVAKRQGRNQVGRPPDEVAPDPVGLPPSG